MSPHLDSIEPVRVQIGFRVECHDRDPGYASKQQIQLGTEGRSSLTTECNIPDDKHDFIEAAANHLARKQVPSPFTSLFRSWGSAIEQRDYLMKYGASDVLIIAIWLKDRVVYDAENIAKSLGYVDCPATPEEETRQLYFHNDEIFITNGIPASENRILATFGGKRSKAEPVLISELTIEKQKLLSELMSAEVELEDVIGKGENTKSLASELSRRTGVLAYVQYYLLVKAICGRPIRDGITDDCLSQW